MSMGRDSRTSPFRATVSRAVHSVANARVEVETYEEAEFAVVTAELDDVIGRERRGGERERGRRDDCGLRRETSA